MRYENDLDATWFSVECEPFEILKERAYTAADCIVQSKLFLEPLGYKVVRIYPLSQCHTNNKQFYQLKYEKRNS